MLRSVLAFILLAVLAGCVCAQTKTEDISTVDVRSLTNEQKLEILSKIAAAKVASPTATVANVSETDRTELSEWGDLGAGMGRAAVAAAKEVGVAANEFVQTPLGKVTMAVVLYKVIGRDVVKLTAGSIVFVVFMSIAVWFMRRWRGLPSRYEVQPVLNGLWYKRIPVEYRQHSDEMTATHVVATIASVLAALVIGLNVMF